MSILSELRFTKPEGFSFGEMINKNGQSIRTGSIDIPNARGTVLLLTGLSEFTEKYFETIRDLVKRGFSVKTFDWYSQGGSARGIPDEPHKIHVTDFSTYLSDLKQFIDEYLSARDFYIMAHSMGGHITLRHLTENEPNPHIMGAILSAPMLSIKILPRLIRQSLKWPALRAQFEKRANSFTVGTVDWDAETYRAKPAGQSEFSSDPTRDRLHREFLLANRFLRTGGQTYGWLLAALNSLDILENNIKAKELKTPTLVCLPTNDEIVSTPESLQVLSWASQSPINVQTFHGAKHEILVEVDKFRDAFLGNFDQLVARRPQFSL